MYKHVMIPTDGSELSAKAVEAGLQLAARLSAQVTAMTVSEPFHTLSFSPSQVEYTPAAYRPCRNHRAKSADLESALFQYVVAHVAG
jgi:nucleotide-binding universal stress UspA family protein